MAEQQIDPRLVDQARQEINRLIGEIEQLAGQDLDPNNFYNEFLRRVMGALAAHACAIWVKTAQDNLVCQFQVNTQDVGIHGTDYARMSHHELLKRALLQEQASIIAPQSGPSIEPDPENLGQPTNPTKYLIVLAPILVEGVAIGLVEVFLTPDRRPAAQQGFMKFLTRVAQEAAKYLKNKQFRHLRGQEQLWNDLEQYIRTVHGALNPKQVAYLIANDGRKLIRSERVSVAIRRGTKTKIEAISGQETVEKRSNLVRTLAWLADRVIFHGENFIYRGEISDHWPKDIVHALERYREECPSKLIVIMPMADQREFGKSEKPTTALIVEMVEDEASPGELAGRIDVVARHGSIALYNALEHHKVFLLPLWRAIGNRTQWLNAYTMPKIWIGLGLFALLIIGLIVVPWPLRLEGRGALVPEVRRIIYAPFNGRIKTVRVDHKDMVDISSILAEMEDTGLKEQIAKTEGDLRAAETTLRNLETQRRQVKSEQRGELESKITELQVQIDGLRQQLKLYNNRQNELVIRSPIRGQIMDWKPKETLTSRPVQQGDRILEVGDSEGDWILEVKMPENTVTHIARARQRRGQDLPVTFVFSTKPEVTYKGTLLAVSTKAETEEQQNYVLAKIRLDPSEHISDDLKVSGLMVRAKIDCGPHAVGYVLFRELIDFVREYVFF